MRPTMHSILPQDQYAAYLAETTSYLKEMKASGQLPAEELAKYEKFKKRGRGAWRPNEMDKVLDEADERTAAAKQLMKRLVMANTERKIGKAGVTSALGFNFYDLRAPVQLSYPVNTPLRNMLPRIGRVNDGYGVAAHWQATRNPGLPYVGVAEGERNAIATPDDIPYIATYKEIGVERGVTFTAQFAGEGYADNVADEHIRGLHEIFLGEEALMWLGNSGLANGNNGFQFNGAGGGTATPTPDVILSAAAADGTLPGATNVSAAVVILTGLGYPSNPQYGYNGIPTVLSGLTPSFLRQNQDGSSIKIPGGISKISPMSDVVITTGPDPSAKFSIPPASLPIKGAFAYAWYVNITDAAAPSPANAFLHSITTVPFLVVSSAPTGAQTGDTVGFDVDNSYSAYDFDGLITYAATTPGAYWKDMGGASFTSLLNGRVKEIEEALEYIWQNFQAGVDQIWGSFDAVAALDSAVRFAGAASSSYRFEYTRDSQGNLLGGFIVSAYQSRYSMNPNGYAIPIRLHPMLPLGTIYFDVSQNPYPHSRAPFTRGMLVQRDYYSIEWPLVTRQWTFGTYCHEVLAHNFPWLTAVLTGIGPFSQ